MKKYIVYKVDWWENEADVNNPPLYSTIHSNKESFLFFLMKKPIPENIYSCGSLVELSEKEYRELNNSLPWLSCWEDYQGFYHSEEEKKNEDTR